MLSIITTLKEFWGILFGADIHVFMDHKNLTFNTLKMQSVLRWHTKLEEFSPILHYIKDHCSILANNLSRLHCLVTPTQITEGKKLVEPTEVSTEGEDKAYFFDQEYSGLYDEDIWECIECYLIRMRIHRIMHTFVNCSNRTNNYLLYKWNIQTIMSTYKWMTTWWHHLL